MRKFEYKAVPAPTTGTKAKGVKTTDERFALSMTDALNEMAAAGFAGVLGLIGRSRRFDQMSLPRFAAWGGAAGVGFSLLFVSAVSLLAEGPSFFSNLPLLAAVFGTAGAGSASGMLALARAAEDDAVLEDAESAALLAEGDASRLPES